MSTGRIVEIEIGSDGILQRMVCVRRQYLSSDLQWRSYWSYVRVVSLLQRYTVASLLTGVSIAVTIAYGFITASLAELASAIPSAGGGQYNQHSILGLSIDEIKCSLPLGYCCGRTSIWSHHRILCRMVQLSSMGFRNLLNLRHSRQRSG